MHTFTQHQAAVKVSRGMWFLGNCDWMKNNGGCFLLLLCFIASNVRFVVKYSFYCVFLSMKLICQVALISPFMTFWLTMKMLWSFF